LKRYRAPSSLEHDLVAKTGVPIFADHAPSRAGVHKREHDALPRDNLGPGIVLSYPTWMALIKGLKRVSSTVSKP
jgi:hypothetical protein